MESDFSTGANAAQARYWNDAPGRKWALYQERLDRLMAEVRDLLLDTAAASPGERVLDIGCGTGDTLLALSDAVGLTGRITGADISTPLLDTARRRAAGLANCEFLLADVQTQSFPSGSFDLAVSRFGTMFFADPVAAFVNIARALRPGGRIAMAAWDRVDRNPWMTLARKAAVDRLGEPAPEPPGATNPFAFADTARVLSILDAAGFHDTAVDTRGVTLHVDGTPQDAARLALEIGPVPRIMQEFNGTGDDRAAIAEAITQAFLPFAVNGTIRVPASVHYYTANRP